MSSADLNIIERGLKGQAWTAEKGAITSGDLAQITEQRTNNSSALNALPTPFARFFVVKEAFRRVLDELKSPQKSAGKAYERLVSDALDVFELLYNITYHQGRWGKTRKVEIREWDYNTDLKNLKTQVPILGEAVENYFSTDLKACGKSLFFIVLKDGGLDYLLATSSPYTGFITPPDLDKKVSDKDEAHASFVGERYASFPSLSRKGGGAYFRDIRLFEARDKDFKNYMFHMVNNMPLGPEMNELRDYIKQVQIKDTDINPQWEPQTVPLLSDNSNELVINGMSVCRDNGISTVNFFNDTIVRLPFRLSKDFYQPMSYVGVDENRDFDFMLPISREGLEKLEGDFKCSCKLTNTKVIVTLKFKGQEYSKDYYYDTANISGRARVMNLQRENIDFNIAVFPNILSPNAKENNYFKVMAVMNDATPDYSPVSVENINISFYYRDNGSFRDIETIASDNVHAKFGVRPAVVRTRQDRERGLDAGSVFYEIFNTQFDALHVRIKLDGDECEGVLLPNWKTAQQSQDAYTYAIDLGTTNTYVSCAKRGRDNEPEQLRMDEPMVAFLHDFKRSTQHSLVSVVEGGIPVPCRKNFKTEFVPSLIDGSRYRFPVRTALCILKGDQSKPALFDNCNIAFFYEKMLGLSNQSVLTDIKWEDNCEKELRVFIRELLLIIKTDILQKNGMLANTKLIWFRPLSFKGTVKDMYTSIWNEEAKNILNISPSQIECISESEAPYYYFSKKDTFNSVDAVSIVDIGGGSSDFMYFADGKPQIANSVHFGCDVLWGNGFSGFDNARTNGIYERLVESVHLGAATDELEKLNIKMRSDKNVSTKDIINFWLSNDSQSEISRKLKENYKPLFLYHFASIVFFMARMYHAKNLPCPRSVLFCGNGSRYIDGLLSSDKNTVKELVNTVFKSVYGDIKDIQVVLPSERKECTCYGGLYRNSEVEVPAEFNFQGVDAHEYANVEELKTAFPVLGKELVSTYCSFNALYEKLLRVLISKGEQEKLVDIDAIMKTVTAGVEDALQKNFKTQVTQKINGSEVYHDSVFFLPIIDNILKLTKI